MGIHSPRPRKPADGFLGLKQNLVADVTAGFIVFLLALPLSLGIAAASGFPPLMGIVTAIIGGIVATFFSGSHLAIKGPAAGLIVIVAGSVSEFGGGEIGWHYTLGVMVVSGLLQVLFGVFKWGRLVDLFPLSAVHGMLAAIGLIIVAKQVPILLHVPKELSTGKGPLELLASIPQFILHLDPVVSVIGGVSLTIMLAWGLVKNPLLKKIPAPLLVLIFAIPAGQLLGLGTIPQSGVLVQVGNLIEEIGIHVEFGGLAMVRVFLKYLVMVALVGSLESLLTVKAVDLMDPYKRKSDANKDLIAIGIANMISAILGGLPMISEVARSSANVAQGGKTRWANFFHGVFLLAAAWLAYPLLEMIPTAALAAMLIAVGIKLAHPKQLAHAYKIGPEQSAIFLTTIFFTLIEDLLIGMAAGMALKIVIHVLRGASWKGIFRAAITIHTTSNLIEVNIQDAAVFTNYLAIKSKLDQIPPGQCVILHLENTNLIDHSVMAQIQAFESDYSAYGGTVEITGLSQLKPVSLHPLSARKNILKRPTHV